MKITPENIQNIEIKETGTFKVLVEKALDEIISNPKVDSIEIKETGQRVVRCGTEEEKMVLEDETAIAFPIKKDGQNFLVVAD